MMRGIRGAMMGGGGWTNPYITDGLVAMYDGEWNAGYGVHDDSFVGMTNLVTGDRTTLTGSVVLGDKYIETPYQRQGVLDDQTLNKSLISGDYTIEVSLNLIRPTTGYTSCIWLFGGRGFFTVANQRIIFSTPSSVAFSDNSQTWLPSNRNTTYCIRGIWTSSNFNDYDIFSDGVNHNHRLRVWYNELRTDVDGIRLGNYSTDPDDTSQVKYYSVRLYDRKLTDNEIAANYAVDSQRFGV